MLREGSSHPPLCLCSAAGGSKTHPQGKQSSHLSHWEGGKAANLPAFTPIQGCCPNTPLWQCTSPKITEGVCRPEAPLAPPADVFVESRMGKKAPWSARVPSLCELGQPLVGISESQVGEKSDSKAGCCFLLSKGASLETRTGGGNLNTLLSLAFGRNQDCAAGDTWGVAEVLACCSRWAGSASTVLAPHKSLRGDRISFSH